MAPVKKQKDSRLKPATNKRLQPSFLLLALIILMLITAIIYGRALTFELTYFDDDAILLRNEARFDSFGFSDAFKYDAEFGHQIDLYRPFANLSFLIDYKLWKFNPGMFHLQSILLHLFSSFFLFLIIRKISDSFFWAIAGAALFAAHPLFLITVAWLPARGDLLLAFWTLLAFLLFMEYLRNQRPVYFILSLLACVFAIFSKENAIVLPVILALWNFLIARKKIKPVMIPAAILILGAGYFLFFWLRSSAIPPVASENLGFKALIANLQTLPETLFYFLIPFRAPSLPFYSWLPTLLGLLITAAIIIYFLLVKKHRRMLLFVFFWFLAFSLPAMFYRPEWSNYCYDYCLHRSYLPLAGFFVLFSIFPETAEKKIKLMKWTVAVMVLIFTAFSVWQITIFSDSTKFFSYAVSTNSKSAFAHQYLANAHFRDNNLPEAETAYRNALKLKPDFTDSWLNLGVVYLQQKKYPQALSCFEQALKIHPAHPKALEMRAKLLFEQSRYAEAALAYEQLVQAGISDYETLFSKAKSHYFSKDFDKCLKTLEDILVRFPENSAPMNFYAHVLHASGRLDEALTSYSGILQKSNTAVNNSNLAWIYFDKKDFQPAKKFFSSALTQDSTLVDALLGMALVSLKQNNLSAARQYLKKASQYETKLLQGIQGIKQLKEERQFYFSDYQMEQFGELFRAVK